MSSHPASIPRHELSPWRGALQLAAFTARRQWRVRSLALVAFALLGLMAATVGILTHMRQVWRLETRRAAMADPMREQGWVRMTYQAYAVERLPLYSMIPGPSPMFAIKTIPIGAYQYLMFTDEAKGFRDDFAFLNFSRWVVFSLFLQFLLPLFVLSYASNAMGSEREGRTMIWLTTRPLPRWSIYVAKFAGVLPWCLAAAGLGFAGLCLAGGSIGRQALALYWPSIFAGTLALTALFHLIGANFRRPAIVGLVYIFFFETLVANLPGSMKRMSLNYYTRSLLFNDASTVAPSVKPSTLDVYEPLGPMSCWIVLLAATAVITMIGAWFYSRQEPKDEV